MKNYSEVLEHKTALPSSKVSDRVLLKRTVSIFKTTEPNNPQDSKLKYIYIIIISIQPEGRFWQEPEPSQATGMALTHCILGSFLGVVCHCFPPPLDVRTFTSRCLHVQAT